MKTLTNNAILFRALKDNQVEHPIENWIVRARFGQQGVAKSAQNAWPKKHA